MRRGRQELPRTAFIAIVCVERSTAYQQKCRQQTGNQSKQNSDHCGLPTNQNFCSIIPQTGHLASLAGRMGFHYNHADCIECHQVFDKEKR